LPSLTTVEESVSSTASEEQRPGDVFPSSTLSLQAWLESKKQVDHVKYTPLTLPLCAALECVISYVRDTRHLFCQLTAHGEVPSRDLKNLNDKIAAYVARLPPGLGQPARLFSGLAVLVQWNSAWYRAAVTSKSAFYLTTKAN